MHVRTAVIIGGGVGGLATACLLGKAGYTVHVLEKNAHLGGRAGLLRAKGFTFDTGPSWYLMPDVFEHFFASIGERIEDHLQLVKLSPSYRVFYKNTGQHLDITGNIAADARTFESIEPGAGQQLRTYLARAAHTYDVATSRFLRKNYNRLSNFITPEVLRAAPKLPLFSIMDNHVGRYFADHRLKKIMEYPLVFLGASPYKAPALYSLMSHADMTQGVWYPMGGMYMLIEALAHIGKTYGVQYHTNEPVERIIVTNSRATGVQTKQRQLTADIVISDAGVHHTETSLLPPKLRDHSAAYWRSRTLAPSALLVYLGVNRQYGSLAHHNLLFSNDWRQSFAELFNKRRPRFPSDPSLYVCAPSKTDPSVAPPGYENLFVLVPVAAGLDYSERQLRAFTKSILHTIEQELELPGLTRHIVYQKSFAVKDFAADYNSFQGTGLGLSHTFRQTAIFRPSNKSKKVKGLFYVGADVHPGIGIPPALISAELVLERLIPSGIV